MADFLNGTFFLKFYFLMLLLHLKIFYNNFYKNIEYHSHYVIELLKEINENYQNGTQPA